MPAKVVRLFEQFHPEDYDLLLNIDKDNLTYDGTVIIKGKKVGRPSKRLTFHQKDLTIKAVSVVKHDKKELENIEISRINTQASYDEVRLHSDNMIYPGNYSVTIEFSGTITKSMHGIYPCYFKHDGIEKTLIATQFESHHAREAFPCIDEPEAKAVFNLGLVTPLDQVVLGNMAIKDQHEKNKRLFTVFEPSPIMSTYLLAFVFGEMHAVTGEAKGGVKVNTWSSVGQPKSHLKYANDEAIKVLEFFNDYFRTPFPLGKIDQVALPDFDAGAMENWGLITFREAVLLADPKNRSLSGEQVVTLVVAHELSHQWFGDLVTMKWWDDLWLNESFASIMENIAPDKLHPDWNQWEDFATGRALSSSHRDIYKDVQAVGVKVKNADEISSLFDPAIVYAKGARLLTMLYDYMGEDDFRKGLELYFKKHAYSNTTRHDLWSALSEVSHKDLDKLMTPWIEQPGQPVLTVKKEKDSLVLTQKRFLMDGDDETSLWPIPLLTDKKLDLEILETRTATIPYKDAVPPIFNINGSAHYIVSYQDEIAIKNIQDKVIKQEVGPIGRITALNDMLLLSRKGEFKLETLLDIVAKCENEPRDAVWSMFMRIIGQAQTLTDGNTQTEAPIKAYKSKLTEYWYDKLGWQDKPSDDPNTKHLRSTALALSLASDKKDAVDTALKAYAKSGNVENLPAEQRAMIAATVVKHGKASDIDKLMKEYVDSSSPDIQQSITSALCITKDVKLAKRLIDWGLKDHSVVRQQDIDHWYAYLVRNHYTRDLAWDWFTSSWDELAELFGGGKHMEYFIWYSAGPMSTPEWQAKFVKFFKPKVEIAGLQRNINIAFSEIEARVEWRKDAEKDLEKYFKNFS
jgi:aminopeptidase N